MMTILFGWDDRQVFHAMIICRLKPFTNLHVRSIKFGIRVLLTQPNNPTRGKKIFSQGAVSRLTSVLANIESALLADDSNGDANEDCVSIRFLLRGVEFGKAELPPGGARLATHDLPTLRLPYLGSLFFLTRWLVTRRFGILSVNFPGHRVSCTAKYP